MDSPMPGLAVLLLPPLSTGATFWGFLSSLADRAAREEYAFAVASSGELIETVRQQSQKASFSISANSLVISWRCLG